MARGGRFISKDELQSQVNIVDVIGRVLTLKRAGGNYKANCPFHNEKTPSFVVSEQKQIFTCFGCGVTGGAVEFVKRYYNLEFREAMERLAKENGIDLGTSYGSGDKDKYYEANKLAAKFFFSGLTSEKNPGYTYMKKRGIDDETLTIFGIGYADDRWTSLYDYMTSKGIDKDILLELGLIAEKNGMCYDKFRNRVMFPIINVSGKVIGFGGRALGNENPKYLNSPENKVFQKKYNLYALNTTKSEIGKSGFAILVEGYMDVISLYQHGVKNVAASLGTALTEDQARLVKRYSTNVILSYDSDGAGRSAALRGIDILKAQECKVKVLHVTDGKDPDEFIKKNGKARFDELIKTAVPMVDYKIEAVNKNVNIDTTEGKIQYVRNASKTLAALSPVEREVYSKQLSKLLGISEGAIKMEIDGNNGYDAGRLERSSSYVHNFDSSAQELPSEEQMSALEATVLKVMQVNPELFRRRVECHRIVEHSIGRKLLHAVLSSESGGEAKAMDAVVEELSPRDAEYFQKTMENIIVAGMEEIILNECIEKWHRLEERRMRENIVVQLSMSDEENGDEGRELTAKLAEINNK